MVASFFGKNYLNIPYVLSQTIPTTDIIHISHYMKQGGDTHGKQFFKQSCGKWI